MIETLTVFKIRSINKSKEIKNPMWLDLLDSELKKSVNITTPVFDVDDGK